MIKEEYKNGCRLKEQVKYNIDYDDCQILNLTCANYIYDLVQESSKYETKLEDIKKMLYMIEKLLGHEVQYDIPEYHGDNKKCYFGVVSDNFVINEDNIKQLDYVLQDTKEFVKSFSTDSDSSESYEYIKITKIPTSGFTFLYSTYNVLSKYSLLYLDNKLYILSDVYDTGNDSFLNIKYLFDSISYTLDIYIKVPTKYGKLIVRDTKWANLNTYQWYSKNTDPYPSEAVDAEFISSNVLTLPNTLIGTKTYDKFGNELTWSKSDWLNPDGSLVTKVIFASKLNDFTKNNTIYNIVRYIDLKGETLTIPENSVLNFIGGAIGNGTIIGNKTKVINLNVDRIILSGTWFDSGITSNRPTNVLVGFQYFDTTVNKPIFWDGSKWIDATGATV